MPRRIPCNLAVARCVEPRMSIRGVLVGVGVTVLVCGVAEPAPRKQLKKRARLFAEFIDPAAPIDPPPAPANHGPTWLSVVLLIDRAVTDGGALDILKTAAREVHDLLEDYDLASILTCDLFTTRVFRGKSVIEERAQLERAFRGITDSTESDLPASLDGARAYVAPAPDRKVIIVFTDGRNTDSRLRTVIAAVQNDNIELLLVVPSDAAAQQFRFMPNLAVYVLARPDALDGLKDTVSNLHRWWP